ncbi:MAG: hypothetical protein U1E53_33805 [Dongiaceae bacterium]
MRIPFLTALLAAVLAIGPAAAATNSTTQKTTTTTTKAAATKPKPKPAAKTQAKPAVNDGKVHIDAALTSGARLITKPIQWTITKASADPAKPGEVVHNSTAPSIAVALQPGDYSVKAVLGLQTATSPLKVVAGKPNHLTVDMHAGYITLSMIPNAGSPRITQPINWEIYTYVRGKRADAGKKMAATVGPNAEFYLPAGGYTVRATYQNTVSEVVVPLGPGIGYDYTINLYAGRLSLNAVSVRGTTPVDKVTWQIVKATPGADGAREPITELTGATQDFILREAKYVAIVKAAAITYEVPFEIKSGRATRVKVTLAPDGKSKASVNG